VPNVLLQVPGLTVLYRKYPVVADWFGFAEPLSVAPVVVTDVAATVVTVGTDAVVNDITVPNPVPAEFEAMAQ
jgi:hypothetical protein